jgi:WD40 repeat protein
MPDGEHLVSASADGRLILWNAVSGQADILESEAGERLFVVAVTPDGSRVVYGGGTGTVKVRDLIPGENRRLSVTRIETESQTYSIALTPDGRIVLFGSSDGVGKLELNSGEYWPQHGPLVNGVAVTPDGTRVVYDGFDATRSSYPLAMWYLAEGSGPTFPSGHDRPILSVCITPDGDFAISGSVDRTIKIWNLSTIRLVRSLQAHSDTVTALSLSRDGRLLASRSYDDTLRIWACDRWEELARVRLSGPFGK